MRIADYSIANELKKKCTKLRDLCDPVSQKDIQGNQMILLFMSNTPLRSPERSKSTNLTTAHRAYHPLDRCTALVLPVTTKAPLYAWSPWTLSRMMGCRSGYKEKVQVEEICNFLKEIIDPRRLLKEEDTGYDLYDEKELKGIVGGVIRRALSTRAPTRTVNTKFDPERAAVFMLRFEQDL